MLAVTRRLDFDARSLGGGAAVALTHPLMLSALLLWVLNDHVFKAAYSGLVTGKLSDIVSLAVFPLLPVAAMKFLGIAGARANNRALVFWAIATGLVMATINVFDSAAWAYEAGLGALQWVFFAMAAIATGDALPKLHSVVLTMDPTDLLTLPALALPLYLGWQSRSEGQASLATDS